SLIGRHRKGQAMNRWVYRGRWALVTGASSGLGAEFAGQLASRGMSLVLSARRADLLGDLAERLRDAAGIEVIVLPEDLGSEGAASRLWRQATDGRRIDLLINNAGFGARGRFDELSVERQSEMVRVNCVAPMELAHLALQDMRTHG